MEQILEYTGDNRLLKEAAIKENSQAYEEAISLYESVISNNQKEFCAYYSLGALYEKLQNNNKAKDTYVKGIQAARSFQNSQIETDLSITLLGLLE